MCLLGSYCTLYNLSKLHNLIVDMFWVQDSATLENQRHLRNEQKLD